MGTGGTAILRHRHEVSQSDDCFICGAKGGLEDIGPREIALGRAPPSFGMDSPGSTALGIEERGKDAATVEARQAAPVDRAIDANEGCRTHIADEAVRGNRLLASGAGAPGGRIG